jgi:restriction endonuclease S subunit
MSHYKPYAAYKESGVEWLGRVPEHWCVVRMRYAATLNLPVRRDLLDEPEQDVSFLPMEAIGEDGSLNLEQNRPVADVRSGYSYFENGDVAFAKVTPCFENGKGALMQGLHCAAGFGTTELTVLRPNPAVADASYINYIVQGSSFRAFGAGAMTGAGGLKRVPDEFTRNFPVSLPELGEQRVIASNLDRETARIDALIEKKTRFIELLREKRQALITHAVTKGLAPNVKMKDSGVEWLGEVPKHWDVLSFQRCVFIAEGQVDPEKSPYREMVLLAPNHIESGSGLLLYTETAEEQNAESGKYLCQKGDVVYSKIRPALRKVCIAPDLSLCSADMYPMRGHSGMSNQFLFWFLLSEPFSAFAVLEADRVAMPKINRESLNSVQLPMPPINEQMEIVAWVAQSTARLDNLRAKTERSIELLKERRSALITAAVTGQIDLREAV